jgi:hypothetical protein
VGAVVPSWHEIKIAAPVTIRTKAATQAALALNIVSSSVESYPLKNAPSLASDITKAAMPCQGKMTCSHKGKEPQFAAAAGKAASAAAITKVITFPMPFILLYAFITE